MVDTRERVPIEVVEPRVDAVEDRPRRLRDLHGRDLFLVLGLLVLVLVPFVTALVRAYSSGWTPSGDVANIGVRSLDVFSRHPPLTGLPSTSYLYGKHIFTYHPGPIEFYVLAIPIRVLGTQSGMLLPAAAINAAAALIALWVFYRRAGTQVMMWAGFLMLAVIWSEGTTVLTDPLSSSMTRYSLLCTAVLAWAVADGDIRLLPLAAFVASYAAQQHLAATMLVAALSTFAVIAFAVSRVRRQRRGEANAWRGVPRYAVAAVVILGVCWAPVALDQATGHPGNITKIRRLAQDGQRKTLGRHSGIVQTVNAIVPPTIIGRDDTRGLDITGAASTTKEVEGALVVAALVAVVWVTRKRRRSLAFLAGTAVVFIAAGVVNGASVPASVESFRSNLYPWTWCEAFLTWTALGWAGALLVRHLLETRGVEIPPRVRALGPIALLVGTCLIATSIAAVTSFDDTQLEPWFYSIERQGTANALARIDRHHPVALVIVGGAATTVSSSIVLGLVKAGVKVELTPDYARFLGNHRRYRPGPDVAGLMVISSGAAIHDRPGTLVASKVFNPEISKLLDELVAEARSAPVVVAPDAAARVKEIGSNPLIDRLAASAAEDLQRDPRLWLKSGFSLQLIEHGFFAQPTFDLAKVRRLESLLAHLTRRPSDERVEVRVLTPAELRAARVGQLG